MIALSAHMANCSWSHRLPILPLNVCHFCERRANEFADSGGQPSPQLVAFIEQQV
jgi:hypothetical protein